MSKRFTLVCGVLLVSCLLPYIGFNAQKIVTGRVLSKTDQLPIPGATVTIKGTRLGTSTSVDGSFSVKAKEGDVLVITGVGVVRQEQPVNSADLTITVAADARELNQVVVTATGNKM